MYKVLSLRENKFSEEKVILFGEDDPVRNVIEGTRMLRTVTDVQPFVSEVVWEFWGNLPSVKVESDVVEVLIQNWVYEFSSSRINQLFGLEYVDERTHMMQMDGVLEDDLAVFMLGNKVKKWKVIQYTNFTVDNRTMYKICCNNWSPNTNYAYAQSARAKIINLHDGP